MVDIYFALNYTVNQLCKKVSEKLQNVFVIKTQKVQFIILQQCESVSVLLHFLLQY